MSDKRHAAWTHIVLSGGGMAGLSYIGALAFLQEHIETGTVKQVSGTSIGAFFGFLYILGISMVEVEAFLRVYLTDPVVLEMHPTPEALMFSFGIDDGERLSAPLVHFLERKFGIKDITFLELTKRCGISFSVCATCLNNSRVFYFSVNSTPDVSVLDAIRASMAVPMLFTPVRINDKTYVDGAVVDNLPFSADRASGGGTDNILGLYMSSDGIHDEAEPLSAGITYVKALAAALLHRELEVSRYKKLLKYLCVFNKTPLPVLPLTFDEESGKIKINITEDKITESVSYGYNTMSAFIHSLP